MNAVATLSLIVLALIPSACVRTVAPASGAVADHTEMTNKIPSSDAEWQQILTAEQFRVLRQHETEQPFKGEYWDNKAAGSYSCAGCGQVLFDSVTKFASGTGWPSFYDPAVAGNVAAEADASAGMVRTEVHCSRCGGHLGHRFPDGPKPTGQRYCINSVALKFAARPDKK